MIWKAQWVTPGSTPFRCARSIGSSWASPSWSLAGRIGKWDEILALVIVALSPMVVVKWRRGSTWHVIRLLLFVDDLLGFYTFVLLVTVIVSWLIAFDVINVRNNVVRSLLHVLSARFQPTRDCRSTPLFCFAV